MLLNQKRAVRGAGFSVIGPVSLSPLFCCISVYLHIRAHSLQLNAPKAKLLARRRCTTVQSAKTEEAKAAKTK